MSFTARQLIATAFTTLGVYAVGDTVDPTLEADALARLNSMMLGMKLQPLLSPTNSRETFPLTANKGGPDSPYTIGPGGDFNTTRPASVAEITGWGLTLGGTSPVLEIPRAMLTDDAFQAILIKGLSNSLFTEAYYNPTYAGGLGSINLWPVPNTAANGIVIYRNPPIAVFSSVTATVDLPDGYDEMLSYNLARRLILPSRVIDQATIADVMDMAATTLATVKRANTKLSDLGTDPALTRDPRGGYNINTGV